jgi:hypothetical protein
MTSTSWLWILPDVALRGPALSATHEHTIGRREQA